jgi:hypothetical protein
MKNAAFVVVALSLLMILTTVAPVLAEDMHVAEGVVAIDYWSGGMCGIVLPSTWPSGPTGIIKGATIRIDARHHEAGTYGAHDSINIDVLGSNGKWLPLTYFATNSKPDFKNLLKAVFAGMPIGNFPQNLIVGLTENDLKVQRHGNRITAELLATQTVRWPGSGFPTVVIPKFKVELDQVGGSFHDEPTDNFASYSGYVLYNDLMGFGGTGTLTCSTWNYVNQPVTPVIITMHGITTYVPPQA